jgi:hypothetical protein
LALSGFGTSIYGVADIATGHSAANGGCLCPEQTLASVKRGSGRRRRCAQVDLVRALWATWFIGAAAL